MKHENKITLVAIVAGLTSGLAATAGTLYLLTGSPAEKQETIEFKSAALQPERSSSKEGVALAESNRERVQRNRNELEWLKRRVAELSSARPAEAVDEPLQGAGDALSPEQAKAAALDWWEDTKAAFAEEPVDRAWAMETGDLFMSDIDGLAADHDFVPVKTECRSTRCSATVEWPTYGEAVKTFTELLHHSYQANCVRHTLLPDPEPGDFDVPYQATVIFDCAGWRDGTA